MHAPRRSPHTPRPPPLCSRLPSTSATPTPSSPPTSAPPTPSSSPHGLDSRSSFSPSCPSPCSQLPLPNIAITPPQAQPCRIRLSSPSPSPSSGSPTPPPPSWAATPSLFIAACSASPRSLYRVCTDLRIAALSRLAAPTRRGPPHSDSALAAFYPHSRARL